jgi:nucleoside 2-deoxyribosyltransferase
MFNALYRTKCYTIGAMEYADGTNWREKVENTLHPRAITVFNPYKKPFINDCDESPDVRQRMRELMLDGQFDHVTDWAKTIRRFDLNLVDRSDFIIAYILPSIASWGTAEELSTAIAARKPIFVIMEGGKKNTPLWLMGQLKHKYIYNTVDEALDMLCKIDDGKVIIDSPFWRLLKKEYR